MSDAAESPGAGVQRRKGLLSLLLVMVFLLGLFALWWIETWGWSQCTVCSKSKADIKTLEIYVIRYKTMANKFPDTLEDFVRKPENNPGNWGWRALMLKEALHDPWGEPYQYRNPGLKNPDGFDLFSKGPDKTEGTEDDIGNWQ